MTYFLDSGPVIGYCNYFEVVPSEDISNDDLDPHAELANVFFTKYKDNISSEFVFNVDIQDFKIRRSTAVKLLIRKLSKKRIRDRDTLGLIDRDFGWVERMYKKLNKRYKDVDKTVYTLRECNAVFDTRLEYCKKNFFKKIFSGPLDITILKGLNQESNLHEKDKNIVCHAIQCHNLSEEIEVVTCEKEWCNLCFKGIKGLKIPKVNYLRDLLGVT